MKTLKELNKKIWYRLLKVFYILIFIIVLFITITVNYSDLKYKLIDNEVSFIKDKNITEIMTQKDFYATVRNAIDSGQYWDISEEEIYNWIRDSMVADWIKIEWYESQVQEKFQKHIDVSVKPFTELNFEKEKYSNFVTFIIWRYYELFLYALLLYIIFFQVINRIFYYIIFGKLIPKKD